MAIEDQKPVDTGFGPRPDGADVIREIDLAGKTAIVTGGYSGIGLETVRALAGKGVEVLVPARNQEKARKSLEGVAGDVTIGVMDLGDMASVRAFAETAIEQLQKLDLLINNAGIMACPETRIGAGWEAQFGTNHLGHMALTQGLLPLLQKTRGARVVALSSTGHKRSDIRWDDIHFDQGSYDKWDAYGQSKTANALFANALSRRLAKSSGLAFSVHPGGIFTPLQRHLTVEEQVQLGWLNEDGGPSELAKQGFKTPEQGCATTLWAATSAQLQGKPGVYCEDCNIAAPTDAASPMARFMGVEAHACDDEAAERLWSMSEAMLAEI
jgi:NAD(P)-dependent dehydrogenase (short-subunit alcohol dehydrogenase family)